MYELHFYTILGGNSFKISSLPLVFTFLRFSVKIMAYNLQLARVPRWQI